MANLVGRDTFTATYNGFGGNEIRYFATGYTATAGSATTINVRIEDGIASSIRMGVYNAAGNLVAETGAVAITPSSTPQTVTESLAVSLTAQTYYLAFTLNASLNIDIGAGTFTMAGAAHTFGALPSTITVPPSNDHGTGEPAIWLDGTAGGGGATLTVDKGDLVLAGQDVTLTATAGVTLTVDKGDLVLTGQDITLVAENDVTLTVDNGSLTLTGQDIPFIYESTASTGQLTLTGQDVTLTLNANVTLTVDNGDLVLTGQDIPFIYESTAATGQLVLTGQDVTLTASSTAVMPVDAGSLQLTGQDVTLIAVNNVRITVDASALTLTGSDVTLLADADITLPVDFVVLQLTGSNVGLTATVSSVDITGPSNLTFVSYSKEFPYETYRVKLRWTEGRRSATSFVSHYKLYKNGTYTGVQIPHSGASTTINYLESGLAKGTYTFRVSAVDNQGNETDQSNQITVTIMTMQDRGWLGGHRWKNLRRF